MRTRERRGGAWKGAILEGGGRTADDIYSLTRGWETERVRALGVTLRAPWTTLKARERAVADGEREADSVAC